MNKLGLITIVGVICVFVIIIFLGIGLEVGYEILMHKCFGGL